MSNFENLQETSHVAHHLTSLNKMYKYEMDLTRTEGAAEWTRDARWMDGQMDRRTNGQMEWNQYTSQQLRFAWGIINNYPII